MSSLATLTYKLEHLCERLENGETLDDDFLQEFADAKLERAQKLSAYNGAIEVMRRNAAFYSERAEQLNRRAKTCERLEKAIKERLCYQILQNPDLPWVSSEGDKFKAQKNQESLKVMKNLEKRSFSNIFASQEDYSDVDMGFLNIVQLVTLNTDAVKQHLKSGKELPWAKLDSSGSHLRIY
jgi:hypothetical protein